MHAAQRSGSFSRKANQIREIEAAGSKVEPRRVVSETVSGSSAIEQRAGF
jgi:putative DNA-invertase from lambdoid prophage Rac